MNKRLLAMAALLVAVVGCATSQVLATMHPPTPPCSGPGSSYGCILSTQYVWVDLSGEGKARITLTYVDEGVEGSTSFTVEVHGTDASIFALPATATNITLYVTQLPPSASGRVRGRVVRGR